MIFNETERLSIHEKRKRVLQNNDSKSPESPIKRKIRIEEDLLETIYKATDYLKEVTKFYSSYSDSFIKNKKEITNYGTYYN